LSKIVSIASKTGGYTIAIEQLGAFIDKMNEDKTAVRKFNFLSRDQSIAFKNSVIPDFRLDETAPELISLENRNPPTADRMKAYAKHAPRISHEVASEAIKKAAIINADITHIITVSCTGLIAPGLEIMLTESLALRTDIKRYGVNFMGCYAAFHALRMANDIVKNNTEPCNVLIVCTELCSLHYRNNSDDDNILSTFLFSDGAAACIVSNYSKVKKHISLLDFDTRLIIEGKSDMSWDVGNNGFEMVLNKNIPIYLRENILKVYQDLLTKNNIENIEHYAIHPGGKNILKAFSSALNITDDELHHSYNILKRCGNMSSATILFVLQQFLESDVENQHVYAAAFGPGLTVESAILKIEA
jgi:alpha-pyrone synthase